MVDVALPAASAAQDRVALLTSRDEALGMLRRTGERLEGLAELAALAEASGDSHLELDVKLRRAAALRLSEDEDRAAELARAVRQAASERGDRQAELAACLELGQDLLRSPLGESFSPPKEVDVDGAEEAYRRACELAQELGDLAALRRPCASSESSRSAAHGTSTSDMSSAVRPARSWCASPAARRPATSWRTCLSLTTSTRASRAMSGPSSCSSNWATAGV